MSLSRGARAAAAAFALVLGIAILPGLPGSDSSSHGSDPAGPALGSGTPVYVILLDELPTATLMTADGLRINRTRFPRIANFADRAVWYRDNVAGGDFTGWAVPAILTGNLSNRKTLPTADAHPNNIFTLLGPGRTVHSLETVTELCPIQICPDGRQGEAPDVRFANEFVKAKYRPFETAEINDWIRTIPAGDSTLSFVHLKLPHLPLRFAPDGHIYPGGSLLMPNDLTVKRWIAGESAISFIQHRHMWQTGFADLLVGRILQKIKQNGDFNRAMIVFTADHGVSYDRNDLRRDVTESNPGATVNPPLMIKYPGQTEGFISTASTQSIDIFPTIAEELGAEIPPTAGVSVNDVQPDRVMTVSKDLMASIQVTAQQIREDRKEVLATQYRRFGKLGLWKLGPRSNLIGRRPGRVPVHRSAKLKIESPIAIRQADAANRVVPAMVAGWLRGVGAGRLLAVGWNGRIVATTRTFAYRKNIRFGAMVPPSVMKRGKNRVDVYLVGQGGRLTRVG